MKVRATQRGHYGHVREIDDEFEVPEGVKGSWFVPVDEPVPAPKAKADKPAR